MAGADRISALPEETKVSILSCLPITDAVRSSVLSRSWRHLWTLLPGFHAVLDYQRGPIRSPENVSRILSSLCGPIRHFSLQCNLHFTQPLCLQNFLDLIFRKDGLWILSLQCSGYWMRVQVQLPYFCSLKDLNLSSIIISLPSDFAGFKQLSSLKLDQVDISQQDIQMLINGSKKLTSIELIFDNIMSTQVAASEHPLLVTLNCPLLKYFSLNFEKDYLEPQIISAPCLESALLTTSMERVFPRLEDLLSVGAAILKFMPDIAHVSHLSLDFDLLMCLSRNDVPHTLHFHFRQLKCLKLIGEMCCTNRRMFKVLCCLLRSMPFLQILELEVKSRIIEELCQIEKASIDAHVVFEDINNVALMVNWYNSSRTGCQPQGMKYHG